MSGVAKQLSGAFGAGGDPKLAGAIGLEGGAVAAIFRKATHGELAGGAALTAMGPFEFEVTLFEVGGAIDGSGAAGGLATKSVGMQAAGA